MCATITRRPKNVNGTVRGRPKGKQDAEPDFCNLKPQPDLNLEPVTPPPSGSIKDILEAALTEITPPAVVTREVASSGLVLQKEVTCDVKKTRKSALPKPELMKKLADSNTPLPVKLHALLTSATDHGFNLMLSWNDAGSAFYISDEGAFEHVLCKKWLDEPTFASFQAELELYGFKRRDSEPDKGAYYHEMFHKALPHLCACIKREQVVTKGRVIESDESGMGSSPCSKIAALASVATHANVNSSCSVTASISASEDASVGSVNSGSRSGSRSGSPEVYEIAMALTTMDTSIRSMDEHSFTAAEDSPKQGSATSADGSNSKVSAPADGSATAEADILMSDPPGRYDL